MTKHSPETLLKFGCMPAKKKRKITKKNAVAVQRFSPEMRNHIKTALWRYYDYYRPEWEYYSDDICETLAIPYAGAGINRRDPYSWLVEGVEARHKKLQIFYEFLKQKAPEMLPSDDPDVEALKICDGLIKCSMFDKHEYAGLLKALSTQIEQSVYVYLPDKRFSRSYDIMEERAVFLHLKRIKKSPFFRIYFFGINIGLEKASKFIEKSKSLFWGQELDESLKDCALENIHFGVAIPCMDKTSYMGFMKDHKNQMIPLSFSLHQPMSETIRFTHGNPNYHARNPDDIMMDHPYYSDTYCFKPLSLKELKRRIGHIYWRLL